MYSIRLLGHRGYNKTHTENTIESFKNAIACGADGIELDLQKTRDGRFIIFHDLNLERLTGKNASVNTIDYAELINLKLPNNVHIPLFEDLLKILPNDIYVNIELKQTIEEQDLHNLYTLMIQYLSPKNIMISSFNHELLLFFREHRIQTGMLIGYKEKNEGFIKTLIALIRVRPTYLNPPVEGFTHIRRPLFFLFLLCVKLFRIRLAFYTVNTREEFRQVQNLADIIITDRIEDMETFLQEYSKTGRYMREEREQHAGRPNLPAK
ncbi:MAG: glycerophosphodiester phosphodiesterase [Spirochaetota bacterium]